ncbi:DUF4328 domain-containing protein [Streptomyces sp. TR02-1]|uniref:DUF4328 domain-containing protein n=1 Tax=Streptomyces sp. TR02-1 TaxID=3385977 RepID=UPI0039A199D8
MTDQPGGGGLPPHGQQPRPSQPPGQYPSGQQPYAPQAYEYPHPMQGGVPMRPQPGQWGPAPPAAPASPPGSVAALGAWTSGLLALAAVLHAMGGVVLLLDEGGPAEAVVLGVASLVMLACGVLTIVWLFRARSNIEHLDPYRWAGRRRLAKGWAIGAWFVPVGFFWLPLQVVLDVWWGTEQPQHKRGPVPKLVVAWWACWIVSWCTGLRVSTTVTQVGGVNAESVSANFFPGATALSAPFAVAAAVLWCLIVRRVTARQTARLGR